jgi:hypothetical protein
MTNKELSLIKDQIDHIQEYINTELCKKCEEMKVKLDILKEIIIRSSNQ